MQTATSETESTSRDLSTCVHHYLFGAPCPKGQGFMSRVFKFSRAFPRTGLLLGFLTLSGNPQA